MSVRPAPILESESPRSNAASQGRCCPALPARALAAALALSVVTLLPVSVAQAQSTQCAVGDSIAERDLPPQAREVMRLIRAGGPFRHDRDGIVFQNRERILPRAPRGFYREYTVRTPGERTRGARRIVCGGEPRAANPCYYTDDHYASFRCIAP